MLYKVTSYDLITLPSMYYLEIQFIPIDKILIALAISGCI
ncbi:putative ECA polymerization protein [Nostoc sp. PCC 7107]|nr:putative ECA polymerization protein [Nostoc sp. PCC 7107]